MTPDLWSYPASVLQETGEGIDVAGFTVEATDGKIGSVDEASNEAGQSFIVVNTGPWIFGKKVMLPASVVEQIDMRERKVFVGRTKQEIKNAPEFDAAAYRDAGYRERVADYYGRLQGRGGM